ncbi:MAG: outer-membrane lipoprotein carrier protein LolA [Bacteroidales bacterium]|nr:outer-membrane lipoprotein carrier protein LolA [Bacteroidales bacterium]
MKHTILIIITLLFSSMALAQQTYDTDFTQTHVMKISGKTKNKAGHLVFNGSDQLSMQYTTPESEYFIIDGNMVKINMDGKKAELDSEKVKMVKLQRSTLLNCLLGNWEQAAQDNNADLTVSEEKGQRTVLIKAKGKVPRGGYNSVEMTYNMADGKMTKLVLEEAIGVVNTYEIK